MSRLCALDDQIFPNRPGEPNIPSGNIGKGTLAKGAFMAIMATFPWQNTSPRSPRPVVPTTTLALGLLDRDSRWIPAGDDLKRIFTAALLSGRRDSHL